MEIFDKLFPKRKLDNNYYGSRDQRRSTHVTQEQVRLLLFKECDWRGRKVLFDSSTVEKVASDKNDKPYIRYNEFPCILEVSKGFTYVYKGPAPDSSLLGEMIFGAVSMTYKGASLKIHIMDEPKRLMCTKVFCVPITRRRSKVDKKTSKNSAGADLHNMSERMNVPNQKEEGVSLSFSIDRGDSGYCEDQTPYSSYGSTSDYFSLLDKWEGTTPDEYSFNYPAGRKLSVSSNGSWQRRSFRSVATRFNLGHSSNSLSVPTMGSNLNSCDSQVYSCYGTSESLTSSGSVASLRRTKLGLALLITITEHAEFELVQRCMEHSMQLQALVCRLRLAALAAAGGAFISTLYTATDDAAKCLTDLMYGPRVQPMWLNLVTSTHSQAANKMAEGLLSDLCAVLSVGDTKTSKFFISTLLTYVLTHHLGWVSTVSPYDTVDVQSQPEPPRPYNALWAQLNDLYGSIGFPPTVARTIISGTNVKFINRLLSVLTYFVRCGDVKRNDFQYKESAVKECKVIHVDKTIKTTKLQQSSSNNSINTQNINSSSGTLVASNPSIKRHPTLNNLNESLNISCGSGENRATSTSGLRRNASMMIKKFMDSSDESSISEEIETDQKVVFVLGDNEKLVGLKNKSNNGKSVKKSSKVHNDPVNLDVVVLEKSDELSKESCVQENCPKTPESSSKCCSQTLQHSKPIKHSGFKFEFDKYPQIVTNYMKSKNLELLDRHYIGKPGNLKLDNFQFDPTMVPPIQEERCETCYKCQLMESMLQTPTNASELEYMNDVPRISEPQFAKETVQKTDSIPQISPKTFVRKRKENTVVVNRPPNPTIKIDESNPEKRVEVEKKKRGEKLVEVSRVVEFPLSRVCVGTPSPLRSGFDASLLGAVTDHYVPDLVLQGTTAKPDIWETQLRRDLELTLYLNKTAEEPRQAVAIIGDVTTWEVRVLSGGSAGSGAGGMSARVAATLDALPAMWRAKVPAPQCLSFLEGKLRELCVLSKTLADILMSTDFCDIATLTKSLNVDVNDVPLLLAVATTHTPQVAKRYGISYR